MYDSIFNEENTQKIAELQTKYETEKQLQQVKILRKENEIQKIKLNRNNYLIFGLLGIVLLAIIIFLLLLRQNKMQAKQKRIILEQKLLRSQMNPHFIFNSLTNIQSLIYNNDETAVKYLARFAKLLRLILENSRKEFITFDEEIQTLDYYLKLQQLRMDNKFEYKINIDNKIEIEQTKIRPMIIQPFVENSIEHGIIHKQEKSTIEISISQLKSNIEIIIKDDGIGRKKSKEMQQQQKKKHKSLAISIIKNRISSANKKNSNKDIQIIDLYDERQKPSGTKVILLLPIIY